MRRWQTVSSERSLLFGAIALRLVDQLTGKPPIGRVQTHLDVQAGAGWEPAAAKVLVNGSGVVTCPGLERKLFPAGSGRRRYRLRIEADYYRPLYRVNVDGVEFDAFPYNDTNPPATFATTATDTLLVPSAGYPFPAHMRVLRGVVVDAATGAPAEDAIVTEGAADEATTDAGGVFALPLRTAPENVPVAIAAAHPRTGRAGALNVTLPAALGRSQTIQV